MAILGTSVFQKSTLTSLLINYDSFTTDSYEIGLVKNFLLEPFTLAVSGLKELMHISMKFHNKVLLLIPR